MKDFLSGAPILDLVSQTPRPRGRGRPLFAEKRMRAKKGGLKQCESALLNNPDLSGSHRSTRIASDLALRALASQAKPQPESESQAFCIARS